jgi:hypothetical protein
VVGRVQHMNRFRVARVSGMREDLNVPPSDVTGQPVRAHRVPGTVEFGRCRT